MPFENDPLALPSYRFGVRVILFISTTCKFIFEWYTIFHMQGDGYFIFDKLKKNKIYHHECS